jgi:integrase
MEFSQGSVYKKNGTWVGYVSIKDGGKWRKRYKSFPDIPCDESTNRGKPAAERALAEWRAELVAADAEAAARAAREAGRPDAQGMTVRDYCYAYVDARSVRGEVEPSTIKDYRHILRLLKDLGNVKLGDVRRADVEAWVTELASSGRSPTTVKHALRVLRQCMRYAVELGDIDKDPTYGVKPPKAARSEPNALDAGGRARLLALLDGMGTADVAVGASLALCAGMRQGEVCGLRWKNVDISRGVVMVREAVGDAEGGSYVKEPKTAASRRDIPMTPQLREALARKRAAALEACLAAGVPFSGELYVLGGADGGRMEPNYLGRQWTALAKAYDLVGTQGRRCTFHDLRHTFATAAVAEGIDVKTVSSLMGHSNAAMTLNIYAAPDPDAKAAAIERLGAALAAPLPSRGGVLQLHRASGE